jgi:hypothetical protein
MRGMSKIKLSESEFDDIVKKAVAAYLLRFKDT